MSRYQLPGALLVVAVLAGCGPMVIWTGHTPDRRARVRVQETDAGQSVTVGDSMGPTYDGIAASGLVFTPGGHRMAYPARKGEKWTVVCDGLETKWWDGIGPIRFSPDGEDLVFPVKDGSSWMVVRGGVPGPRFHALVSGTFRFDSLSGHLAYAGERGDSVYVVVDTVRSPPFDEVTAPEFLKAGGVVAFAGRRGEYEHIVVGNEVGPAWEAVAGLTLNPNTGEPAFFGREGGAWFALVDGNRFGPYEAADGMAFSPNGEAWAFMARYGSSDHAILVGKEGPAKQAILPGSLRLSPRGDEVAYVVRENGTEMAVVGSRTGPPFTLIRNLEFSPSGTHYAYIGVDSLEERVVVNGEVQMAFENVSDLTFSANGEKLAYLAWGEEGGIAFIGPDQFRFPVVAEGSLVLSPGGDHWAVIAAPTGTRQLRFHVDGTDTGRTFDWQELVDNQMNGPGKLPDLRQSQEAVRTWVRAEMELFLARMLPLFPS